MLFQDRLIKAAVDAQLVVAGGAWLLLTILGLRAAQPNDR